MKKLQRSLQIKILLSSFLPIIFLAKINFERIFWFLHYVFLSFSIPGAQSDWKPNKLEWKWNERLASKSSSHQIRLKLGHTEAKIFVAIKQNLHRPNFSSLLSFSSGLVIVNLSVGLVAKQANQTSFKKGGIISQLLNLLLRQLLKGLSTTKLS